MTIHPVKLSILAGLLFGTLWVAPAAYAVEPDWKAVEQALGKPGQLQPGDVFRIGMPRTDLSVTVKGVPGEGGLRAWLVRRVQADGRSGDGHGRSRAARSGGPGVMSGLSAVDSRSPRFTTT